MHEDQDQAPLQALFIVLCNEGEYENKKLGEEPLGQNEDNGIPVELIRQFYLWNESFITFFVLTECQTEMDWFVVETKISVLEEKLKDRPPSLVWK